MAVDLEALSQQLAEVHMAGGEFGLGAHARSEADRALSRLASSFILTLGFTSTEQQIRLTMAFPDDTDLAKLSPAQIEALAQSTREKYRLLAAERGTW